MGPASEPQRLPSAPRERELGFEDPIDGRYRLVRLLGGGGMGEVYEVEHVRLKRRFALKVLRAELASDHELTARFDREVRAVATLHSDHVVSVVDSGTLSDGRPFFVMERLQGQDLQKILTETAQLQVARAVSLAIDICLGLHAAHSAGLVHRDLKPENVFVTRGDDARERCKLLDFGVVKSNEPDYTRPGALLGTARYMAPEQVSHDTQVGPAADLFALGVVLYRCLSGQHPFAADSLERVLFRVMNDTPAPLDGHVPAELAALVARALAKAPSLRPASALDFARSLARFSAEARKLDGGSGWQVATALSDDTLSGDPFAADTTPAIAGKVSRAPVPTRLFLALLGLVALSIAATLAIDRLLTARSSSVLGTAAAPSASIGTFVSSARPWAQAPTSRPVTELSVPPAATTSSLSKTAASSESMPRARPRAKNTIMNAGSKKPESPPNATQPQPSSSSMSPSWFDPRNPYGK
ncbi:MAG: serine/threonine-protein kinase [Polyangiaceae bacterium]